MRKNRFLEAKKAVESLLYIAHQTTDLFHIVKVQYYADTYHIDKYGRLIAGDYYVAMEDGPVPSGAYDLIKLARGNKYKYEQQIIDAHPEEAFSVEENTVKPLRKPNMDYLSESDVECLDKAIKKYAHMDPKELWEEVHKEKAYKKTIKSYPINSPIRTNWIIESLPNGREVIEYLES